MAESVDCSEFCRICLVKDQANVPIFEEQGDMQQTYLKISTCLPIKVSYEDSLPKRICDGCNYKLEQQYQFWNTSLNAEKQLKQWLGIPDVPEVVEAPLKIKREKDSKANVTTKRPRRNARRKAAVNVRQVVAAVAASDSGPGEDMDMDNSFGKDDDMDHNDYNENSDALTDSPFINSNIDSEQVQAGPSGLQKNTDVENADVEETPGNVYGSYKNVAIKQDPGDFEPIVTILELPVEKELENQKKRTVGSGDEADLTSAKLNQKRKPKTRAGRKKKKIQPTEDESDEDDGEDEDDTDFKPTKSTRKVRAKKTKKLEKDEEDDDGYRNPFNYGFDIPTAPTRKRRPFTKSPSTPNAATKPSKSKWSCLICLADLASKEALIAHYAVHKDDPVKQEQENSEKTGSSTQHVSINELQCQLCGQIFETDKLLRKHCETHIEERFHCDLCNKFFKRAYDFSMHSKVHSNEPKIKCTSCDFETIYQCAMNVHNQRHESNYKYKCEICNKGFFALNWYEEHKNFHTGAKPFVCEICDKPFAYTRYLTAHKRIMHPESYRDEPIVNECDICNKRFAHQKSLMLHMRGHTGENTVLCDICGKRLSSNEHLKFHRRIHTGYKPYTCDVCSKGFAKKCNLTLHLRVHSGEKPYVCDVCGKCFSQRSTLVIHERYHTGQRPYTCHLCQKGFVAKGVLSIHLKSCSRNTIMGSLIE